MGLFSKRKKSGRKKKRTFSNRQLYRTIRSAAASCAVVRFAARLEHDKTLWRVAKRALGEIWNAETLMAYNDEWSYTQ